MSKYWERKYLIGLHMCLLPSSDALTFGFTEVNAIWNSLALVLHAFPTGQSVLFSNGRRTQWTVTSHSLLVPC